MLKFNTIYVIYFYSKFIQFTYFGQPPGFCNALNSEADR
jgi:hypothetical protein